MKGHSTATIPNTLDADRPKARHNRPAVKILIPYLAGIILADRFDFDVTYLWILSSVSIISTLLAYKKRWLSFSSFLLVLSFLSIGFLRYEIAMIPPRGLNRVLYQQVEVRGTVVESRKERSGGSSLIVKGEVTPVSNPSAIMTGKISIRSWEEVFPRKYGDVVEVEGQLTRPRLPRNPGAFDYRKYLTRRGIFATMNIDSASGVRSTGTGGNAFLKWVDGLRRRIERVIDQTMPPESASVRWIQKLNEKIDAAIQAIAKKIMPSESVLVLKESSSVLKGILLGSHAVLSQIMYQAFLRTGSSHILVVSGLHMAIIAGWAFLLFNSIRRLLRLKSKRVAYIAVIPVVIIHACIVGFRASVARASILVIMVVLAAIMDRDTDIFNSLAVAALAILIYYPCAIFDAGFHLSFGAVASIAYLMPHWQRYLSRIDRDKRHHRMLYRLIQLYAVSWSAQMGVMPIIAHTFRTVAIMGLFVGPIVVSFAALIIPIGYVQCLIGLVHPPLAAALGCISHVLISSLSLIVSYFGAFWWSYLSISWFSFWHLIVFSAIIIFIANLSILLKQKRRLMVAGVALSAIFIWAAAFSYEGHVLRVTYLDVGQGDSIFVDLPIGDNILIDGGPYSKRFDTGEHVVSPFLQHEGVSKLNMVISTHPHNDHAGGLTHVVENFRVGEVITGSYGITTPTYEQLRARLDRKGIKYHDAQVGTILKDSELHVEVLGPRYLDLSGSEDSRMNNNSVVLRVTYKGVSFLFTGDIGGKSERLLINSERDIKAAVLKVPHQGSKTSSSWEFLRAVQPVIGIIPVGRRNIFRHPSPLILGRYRRLGIKTYRTDRQGAITVVTDGRSGWIKTMLGSDSKD